ncbi:hypothetical protein PRZ48_009191 [Zasmidium cellare]|uniref:NAD(P)-binding protein n=1 Tax=Zasmidium cellare TaxID=395010 RepID=A0ABR0EBP2_ZASCE|nr:hypothetical protein PRZ48_009191 [Zasmidium cellare]
MSYLKDVWVALWIIKDALVGTFFVFAGGILSKLVPASCDLTGKTAVITGGNSGVGFSIASELAERGAVVVLACRNEKKAVEARDEVLKSCPGAKVRIGRLDNESLASVRRFAEEWTEGRPIDFLFLNAGIARIPEGGSDFSGDGFELIYQVNFLAGFLLTRLLERHLSPKARVVLTTSAGSYLGFPSSNFVLSKSPKVVEKGFHVRDIPLVGEDMSRYSQSKSMQIAFAKALQRRFDQESAPGGHKMAFSFMPGLVHTNIFTAETRPSFLQDPVLWIFSTALITIGVQPRQGGATGVHLASSDASALLKHRGGYFDRLKPRANNVDLISDETLERLWIRWSADAGVDA